MKRTISAAVPFLFIFIACTLSRDDTPRAQLNAVLRDSLAASLNATASYLGGSTHLQIDVDSAGFSGLTDADREMKARHIAELALRHYSRAAELDSVTIQSLVLVRKGVARIIWRRDFSISEVRNPPEFATSLVSPDSVTDESGSVHTWYRVAVSAGGREDTLAGVMAHQTPVALSRNQLTGLSFDSSGKISFGYEYSTASRTLTRVPLPPDISPWFSKALLSPNGKLLAYIAQDSQSRFSAVLREWPVGGELARANAGLGYGSDVGYNELRWDLIGDAEYWIRVQSGSWVHAVLSTKGVEHQDTTAVDPARILAWKTGD